MKLEYFTDTHHVGHNAEPTETLYDNSVEYTRWGYCYDCDTAFVVGSVAIVDELGTVGCETCGDPVANRWERMCSECWRWHRMAVDRGDTVPVDECVSCHDVEYPGGEVRLCADCLAEVSVQTM